MNIVASISGSKFNGVSSHGVEAGARSFAAVTYSVFSSNNRSAMTASTSTSTVYAKNNTTTNCATGINAHVGARRSSRAALAFTGIARRSTLQPARSF